MLEILGPLSMSLVSWMLLFCRVSGLLQLYLPQDNTVPEPDVPAHASGESRFSRILVLRTSTFFDDAWPVVLSSIYFLDEFMHYKNNIYSERYVLVIEYSFFKHHSIQSY
ncbi:hypothetical protein YN28_003408 [Salmonella enterica subsp. enterica]|nr:hypothetical protein [Salmonella enterica subsp. enterica]